MLDLFQSGSLLVARAGKHIDEFDAVEQDFIKDKPYLLFNEIDPQSGATILKAKVTKPFPPELSAIAFDIVNCLRSALDHVVYDASIKIGGKPKPKSTKFPIGNKHRTAAEDLRKHKAEVPGNLWPYLLGFEPHPGGVNLISELNDLRNGNIHKTLDAVAVRSGGISCSGYIHTMVAATPPN